MTKQVFKRPESVLVVVYTRSGEVLMLRRCSPPDFWQSVTGSLKWGESPRLAAARELYEETGLQVGSALEDCRYSVKFPIIEPWRTRYAPGVRENREHWFRLCLPARRQIRLHRGEHTEYRWLPAGRAASLANSWTNRDAIRWMLSYPPGGSF